MIFDKEAKITQWNKIMFSTNDPGTTELAYAKKEKLDTDLTTFIKKQLRSVIHHVEPLLIFTGVKTFLNI